MKVGKFLAGRDRGKDITDIRNKEKQGTRKVLNVFGESWDICAGWMQAMGQEAMVTWDY